MSTFGSSSLGSLTQSARKNQLKSARGILIAVGILTLIGNLIFLALAESQVKDQIDKQVQEVQRRGMVVDRQKLAEVQENQVMIVRLIHGGAAALGIVFVVLGLAVYKYPVPATIAGLVLYIGANAVFFILNPELFKQVYPLLIKIAIAAALVKSIQSAIEYEREKASEMASNPETAPVIVQNPWDNR